MTQLILNRRRIVAAAAAVPFAAGLGRAKAADKPLKIGVINPFSGPMALYGDEVTCGYQLAADQANAAGGILGRQIELVRGDAANAQQAIATVDKLATQDEVDRFKGTYISAVSNTASDAAMRYSKIYWETNALAENLTERGLPNFVRSGPSAAAYGIFSVQTITGLVTKALHKDITDVKVWVEHEDSVYGTSIAERQVAELRRVGAVLAGRGAHPANAMDESDAVLRAKRANPDVWMQTGYAPDSNMLLRTARDQGFQPPVLLWVGIGDTVETLEALGADFLEGMLVVTYPRIDIAEVYGPGVGAYAAAYRAKYNRDVFAPQSMNAYVGFQIMLEAVKAAGSLDMDKVRAAAVRLDKPLSSYATGYGVRFDEKMQNTRAVPTTVQWQSGKVVTVYPALAAQPGTTLRNLPRHAA
jgi:branched-chain amino acid transport system substrate-binding protein